MKRLGILIACIATMAMMISCGSAGNVGSSNAAATAEGLACGKALAGLYSSYKAKGKIELSNNNDLVNSLAVATAYTQLKTNKDNADYTKAFRMGMVSAAPELITTANVNSIMDKMLSLTGLTGVNAQNISQKAETAAAILTLVKALKG